MNIGISMDAYLCAIDSVEAVKRLSKIGYDALDFNLSDFCWEGSKLTGSDYEKWFRELKEVADENNIVFSQVHAPFKHVIDAFPDEELYNELTERCFIACQIMNIPFAVFHPMYFDEGTNQDNYQATVESNVVRMDKWAELAQTYKTNIAIENIFNNMWNSKKMHIATFGADIDEIINVVNLVNAKNIGICLDTGHAFCSGINPANAVMKLGKYLKVLHIHDNNGKGDQHVAPFVGNIDWKTFMKNLKIIGYNSTFSLEVHNYVQRMPKELIDDAVALSLKIAKHLCTQ